MTDKVAVPLIRTDAVSQLFPAAWADLQQLIAAGPGASPALLRAAAASRAAIEAGVLVRQNDEAAFARRIPRSTGAPNRRGDRIMTTWVSVPVIRTDADLAVALARIDAIVDAPDGTPEADERATLGILISVYEERRLDWSWIGAPTVPTGMSHDLDDIRAASEQRGNQPPGTLP